MANKEKCWSCGKEFDHDPEDGPPQCEECFRHMCEAMGVDPVTGGEIRECEHCHETCVQVLSRFPACWDQV